MARQWTEEEICRTIELIKREDPLLWERYIDGEKTNHCVDPEDWAAMERLAYRPLFQEVEARELGGLVFEIRKKIRSELKLEWPKGNFAGLKPGS